jgi:hypothetical protein
LNLALFSIDLDLTNQGKDVLHSAVLTLRLRQSPPVGVNSTVYQVFDPLAFDPGLPISANPPRSSPGAPTLTLVGATSGQSVSPAVPDGPVTVTMPGAGVYAWIVRCIVNGGVTLGVPDPNLLWERMVVIRDPSGRRAVVATERTQYSDDGWAEAFASFVLAGLSVVASAPFHKDPVRCATTANIAALTGTPVVDGVATVNGDRVLVKDQAVAFANGIYIVGTPWTRALDFDASAEVRGATLVAVSEGASNGDSLWQLSTDDPITLGVTSLAFVPLTDRQEAFPALAAPAAHDFALGEGSTTLRLPVAAGLHRITGFLAPSGGGRQRKELWNAGPGTLAVLHQNTGSAAANRTICAEARDIVIGPESGVLLSYDFVDARWRALPLGVRPLPFRFVSGGNLSPGGIPATQVAISFVAARSDDDSFDLIGDPVDADITVVGAGGLDAGLEAASTWYAVWLIGDSTGTNALSSLLSTSGTAPTMPAGYDRRRRVGWVRNDGGSNLRAYHQTGLGNQRNYTWDVPRASLQALAAGAAVAFTALLLGEWAPAIYAREAMLDASIATTNDFIEFRTGAIAIVNGTSPHRVAAPANNRTHGKFWMPITAAAQTEYRVSAGATGEVYVLGWREYL